MLRTLTEETDFKFENKFIMGYIWLLLLVVLIFFSPSIIIIGLPIYGIIYFIRKNKRKKEEEESERNYNYRLSGTIAEYGKPSRTIRYEDKYMLIYEDKRMLYLEGKLLDWNNIVDVRIPQEHEVYETDNSNMVKRSLLGWLLFGNVGGAIGGATSRRVSSSYKNNKGRFHLLIQTDKIQCPNIHVLVGDSNTFEEIRSCLNIIRRSA